MNDDVVHRARIYLALGFVLLCGVGSLSLAAPAPTFWSPYPGAYFLPLSAGVSRPLVIVGLSALFVVWNLMPAIQSYEGRLLYLAGPGAILSAANGVYLVLCVAEGVTRYGVLHVGVVTMANFVLMATFWVSWYSWRSNATSSRAVTLGFVLFAWLASYSFPYLGEGI